MARDATTPVAPSRMVAYLGHEDGVSPRHPSSDLDSSMITAKQTGHFKHTQVEQIRDMGWYIDGVDDNGLVWFHKK